MTFIDLSQLLGVETPVYPNTPELIMTETKTIPQDHCSSYVIQSSFHVGTHLDVPGHLIKDNRLVSEFPLEQFIGNGVLLDVRGQTVIEWQDSYETRITKGDMVLLYTDMVRYLEDSERYFGHHPTVGLSFAEKLVEKGIKLLGMDMPAPDYPPFPIHKLLFSNDILILENLQHLEKLVAHESFRLMAFPLKVQAEASFVRAVAEVKKLID